MAARGWVAIVLAGCGFHTGASGDLPGDGGPDALHDAPVDLLDDLDDDNDGILDVVDNCPLVANPDQHDEDKDLIGDACDACPQLAHQETDSDGDGVGDACDPHPGTPGDVLVHFDGFGTPVAVNGLPAGWTQVGGFPGDWGVSQDSLQLDTHDTAHLLAYAASAAHTTVDLVLDTQLPGPNVPSFSAIVDADAGMTTFLACSSLYTEQSRRLQTFAGGAFSTLQLVDGTVTVPGPHHVIATVDASLLSCTWPAIANLSSVTAAGGGTGVGIRVRNLRVSIHYIAIYRSP